MRRNLVRVVMRLLVRHVTLRRAWDVRRFRVLFFSCGMGECVCQEDSHIGGWVVGICRRRRQRVRADRSLSPGKLAHG